MVGDIGIHDGGSDDDNRNIAEDGNDTKEIRMQEMMRRIMQQ